MKKLTLVALSCAFTLTSVNTFANMPLYTTNDSATQLCAKVEDFKVEDTSTHYTHLWGSDGKIIWFFPINAKPYMVKQGDLTDYEGKYYHVDFYVYAPAHTPTGTLTNADCKRAFSNLKKNEVCKVTFSKTEENYFLDSDKWFDSYPGKNPLKLTCQIGLNQFHGSQDNTYVYIKIY